MFKISERSTTYTKVFICLCILNLFVRLLTLQNPQSGPDEMHYWEHARNIVLGIKNINFIHKSARFSLIIPLAIIIKITSNPLMYYILPILMSFVHLYLIFLIIKNEMSKEAMTFVLLGMILFPYFIDSYNKVLPDITSITYLLLTFYFYNKGSAKGGQYFVLMGIFHFLAYLSKITMLYFGPAFFILLLYKNKKIKPALIYSFTLLIFFLIETFLYSHFSSFSSRLDVIMSSHLSSNNRNLLSFTSFTGLFLRYKPQNFYILYQLITWPFFLLFIFLGRKINNLKLKSIFILIFTYFFFMTFVIESVNPIVPVNTFRSRYFNVALPFIFIGYGYYFDFFFSKKLTLFSTFQNLSVKIIGLFCSVIVISMVLFFSSGLIPRKFDKYSNDLRRLNIYPVFLLSNYYKIINKAYSNGWFFLSTSSDDDDKKLLNEIRVLFLNDENYKDKDWKISKVYINGEYYWAFSRKKVQLSQIVNEKIIWVSRPFTLMYNSKLITSDTKIKKL
ncbi:glycosyltransferase family 39 protein [Spirochaeta cellobiosiphila]|uniref:glycosyltransferase family 39 protein n=1 Tax=Spirochaeta cellobiosiphila TaxID=504483 RepID=UPI0003F7AFCF|nr:glycosyltransferase family 39 protein [Spirochaeta cellobiosiphila]